MDDRLLILTWLWTQDPPMHGYGADKVNLWAQQMRRHLTIPYRLGCVTDTPEGIDPDIEIIPLPSEFGDIRVDAWSEEQKCPQCYRRLTLFAPDAERRFGAKRIVSMDMDVLVTGNLDSLFTDDCDFRILKGTSVSRAYNGGMVMLRAGVRPQVFEKFTPEGAIESRKHCVGSDQAWISYVLGRGERMWAARDGVYYKRLLPSSNWAPPSNMRLLFFPGSPKPWDIMDTVPWIKSVYEGKPIRHAMPALHAYDDPKHWGKWFATYAKKRGIRCKLFTGNVPHGEPAFVRLDQQGAQRAISKQVAKQAAGNGCVTLPTLQESEWYDDKVAQYRALKQWMPTTRIIRSLAEAKQALGSMTFPVISKAAEGAGSANVRVLKDKHEALAEANVAFGAGIKLSHGRRQQGYVYWQDIVPGNDCDYRVCVVGQYLYGLKRQNRPGTLFASGSGKFSVLTFQAEREITAARLAIEISQHIHTQWMAYDIVFDGDKPMALEMSSAWTMESYKDCRLHTFDLQPTTMKGLDSFGVAVDILTAAQAREIAA